MVSTTLDIFRECVEFNIENKIKRPVLGLGAPGIGKSEVIKQLAKKRNLNIIDIRLLLFTEAEIKGVPFPSVDNKTTKWLPMDIFPSIERDGVAGILLLDEITAASKKVMTAIYQLILDRRLGEYVLPEGWFIVGLGNREDDGGLYNEIPPALVDRFEVLFIRQDFDVWKRDYAFKNIHPIVLGYLNSYPQDLHNFVGGSKDIVFPTPRSWSAVSDVLYKSGDNVTDVIKTKIAGNIGISSASRFNKFLDLTNNLVDCREVYNGKSKKLPKNKEETFYIIGSLISMLASDLGEKTYSQLNGNLISKMNNVINYLMSMDKEYALIGVKDFKNINKDVMTRFILGADNPKLDELTDIINKIIA